MIKTTLAIASSIVIHISLYGQTIQLEEFCNYDPEIEHKVDEVFQSLGDTARVAQMIVTSAGELDKPDATIIGLAKNNKLGELSFSRARKRAIKI